MSLCATTTSPAPDQLKSITDCVLEFHEKYGHYITNSPQHAPESVRSLRMNLCMEEFNEFFTALIRGDLTEMADGAADLIYVLVGTCISYGIDIDRVFREVHRSNMTKTAVRAKDGEKYGTKTPKGPDYLPPNINGILYNPDERTQLEERHNDIIF